MSIPEYLVLPEVVPDENDTILNDSYFPDLSMYEFEQNYQVTDVFQGKTRTVLETAKVAVNNQIDKEPDADTLAPELNDTYKMCVYAAAMMFICTRYGSVDTQTKDEYVQERKTALAQSYKNEYRRLLLVLSGNGCEVT